MEIGLCHCILMSVAWNPDRWWDWCMSEDEEK